MAYLGLALVIANDYRDLDRDPNARIRRKHLPGTHEDSKDYVETFERYLKFKVMLRHNLSGSEICSAVDDLISGARHCPFGREEECVAFVFCGHGEEGVIVGQNGAKVDLGEIFKRFTSSSDLVPLVKLFFIDACRGENEDRGVWTARGGEVRLEKLVPSIGNVLIAYSTLRQFRAYELTNNPRGLFSGFLNQELRNDANIDHTWDDIITIVTERMVEESRKLGDQVRFQIPERHTTLHRIVKPLKKAKEFQPLQPVAAPRRRVGAPNQRDTPPQQSSATGEPSPSLWAAGRTAGARQGLHHQTAAWGSTHPSLQPASMAHQSLPSGPAPAPQAHWTTPPAATPTPGVAGGTPRLLVDGPTPTPYVFGATPPSYVSGATPPSYVSGATPTPPRATSLPPLTHNLLHLTAREAAQAAARQAERCLKKNFTEDHNTLSGKRYRCEVEFLHSSGRLCKGKSGFHASKDVAEEDACQDLLRNLEWLSSTSTLTADAAAPGNQQRIQPSLEPNASSTREGSHIAPPLGTDAAQQTFSVTARSVAHPPYYEEHPQSGPVSSHDESQSSPFSTVTNYQGQPQVGGTLPTNYWAQSQVATTPYPNYQGYPQTANTDHSELLSATTYHEGPSYSNRSEGKTPKMQLKEYCEQRQWPQPHYFTEHSGRTFQSKVLVHGLGAVIGSEQASKKKAEHDAAAKAISQLGLNSTY